MRRSARLREAIGHNLNTSLPPRTVGREVDGHAVISERAVDGHQPRPHIVEDALGRARARVAQPASARFLCGDDVARLQHVPTLWVDELAVDTVLAPAACASAVQALRR